MELAAHPSCLATPALLLQCEVRRQRRSGPGGQHRNKVETAVVLVHQATGLRGEASERRSQAQNLKVAVRRLRIKLAIHFRSPPTSAGGDERSPLWQSRVRSLKIAISPAHDDYPALLAEALDVLSACGFDARLAGTRLSCSPSQLVHFLKLEPESLPQVNEQRGQRGLRPLR